MLRIIAFVYVNGNQSYANDYSPAPVSRPIARREPKVDRNCLTNCISTTVFPILSTPSVVYPLSILDVRITVSTLL